MISFKERDFSILLWKEEDHLRIKHHFLPPDKRHLHEQTVCVLLIWQLTRENFMGSQSYIW